MDIPSVTVRVAPDLLIALAILSDTTLRRSEVDREDLKPYWKSEKRPNFPLGDKQFYIPTSTLCDTIFHNTFHIILFHITYHIIFHISLGEQHLVQ